MGHGGCNRFPGFATQRGIHSPCLGAAYEPKQGSAGHTSCQTSAPFLQLCCARRLTLAACADGTSCPAPLQQASGGTGSADLKLPAQMCHMFPRAPPISLHASTSIQMHTYTCMFSPAPHPHLATVRFAALAEIGLIINVSPLPTAYAAPPASRHFTRPGWTHKYTSM